MKILLRLLIKLIATPVFLFWISMMLIVGYAAMFWDWLYDKSDFEKSITRKVHQDFLKMAKVWFTTI